VHDQDLAEAPSDGNGEEWVEEDVDPVVLGHGGDDDLIQYQPDGTRDAYVSISCTFRYFLYCP